jgi:hypothetical protein
MLKGQSILLHSSTVLDLFNSYEAYRRSEITSRRFTQTDMLRWLDPMLAANIVRGTDLGHSAEGRTISLYTYGEGPTRVLLWSQMHGDEPTATMALLDIVNFLGRRADDVIARAVRANLTLLMIPMLNPDGAERFTRRTAQRVDMNRDAATLQTPEAAILRDAQHKYKPEFGFNLHDQEPRLTVGSTKDVAAIALLAPAMDAMRGDNEVRLKAKKVATVLTEVLNQLVPGHIAKYDDTFDRRAFGDSMQLWGTSTVLIESGGWPNDRDKMFIRKLNAVALLATLYSIATREYEKKETAVYEGLPFNSKNLYDVIVRGIEFKGASGTPPIRVDIAINIEEMNQEPDRKRLMARVVDLGDLTPYSAFEEREGKGISLSASDIQLDMQVPWQDLQILLK